LFPKQSIGVNERAARDHVDTTPWIDAVARSKGLTRSTAHSRPLWQRVLAVERLPKHLSRQPKCEGTIEDHRNMALDVREPISSLIFQSPFRTISIKRLRCCSSLSQGN
jgi:hypothetical protein